ncbi:MAG: NTP transferase domain-containing protein [Bacteroidetes bacterium]|nr:NTP transferase domain-containing protein [Bacteroidota bacterium]
MKAVILAGGLGSRLKPFTDLIPKPLLPIGEKAVLEIQIEQLKKSGFDEIFLATNHKSEYIENFIGDGSKYGVQLIISKEKTPLGTVGPLSLLKEQLQDDPFLVMNGDVLTKCDFAKLYKFAKNMDSDLIISVKELITPFKFGNISSIGDYVTEIIEKPNIKTNILAGIYIMKRGIFNYIRYNIHYDMDELINDMIIKEDKIAKYELKEYWLDIGGVEEYKEAQDIYNTHFK